MEKERIIDAEIKQAIEKYRMKKVRTSGQIGYSEDIIEVVDGNAHAHYALSEGDQNDDGDSPNRSGEDVDKDGDAQMLGGPADGDEPLPASRRNNQVKINSQRI
mgnify:CR=1 FL=1